MDLLGAQYPEQEIQYSDHNLGFYHLGPYKFSLCSRYEYWRSRNTIILAAMGRLKTAGVAAFLALGGFLFGYDSGIISSTIAQPHFIQYMGTPSSAERGGIVSSFTGGAILGALSISFLADRFGRRLTVFIGSVISVIGSALQGGAVNTAMLIAGRLIAGFSVGLLSAIVPLFSSEIAISQDRGKLSGLLQFMLSWGFFVAQWLGYGCFQVDSNFQWRFPLSFQTVPGLIMAIGIWFLPESPRWLVEKERFEEAKAVLDTLHGNGSNEDFLQAEYREIVDTITAEKQIAVRSWREMFSRPSWRRRLTLGMGIQAFGQLSGINVINYYGPQIYEILGIDTGTSLQIIGISGSLSIVYCVIGLWLLDRIGRIKPLVITAGGMAAALLVNSVLSKYYVLTDNPSPNENALRAMVAMNFVFSLFFTMIGVISWVYPAEIFPAEIRARGNSLSTVTNWSLNLVFAQCAPIALEGLGFKFFYFFFAWNLIAAVCYLLFYPETKGKTLEGIDELFGDQPVVKDMEDGVVVTVETVEESRHKA
ncbi:sugar porter family MFS transporter [Aspergillus fischeri NRRL 181]|uniref:Sugar transporter n=1 Tax=Neosartorya fischeri (strain ATCC 1020 / DSM 3700 / CBS 544.65 / FGSC A1164 / JCM 1740 / NRRL 181 / WB 181) TaxID=331117 RepID=A1D8T3_NEOFI|nr:sugar transporter [Aspergillus fischeri NRRL 181]EAW20794.1 sugar transporter [Aspergillus fischeri NRRL 181]